MRLELTQRKNVIPPMHFQEFKQCTPFHDVA